MMLEFSEGLALLLRRAGKEAKSVMKIVLARLGMCCVHI